MFTSSQFVDYVKAVHAAAWVYWYGTCGYKCTDSLYKSKAKQYPAHYTEGRESGYLADIRADRMCADCVGLIKSFFWKGGDLAGKNVYQSNNCPDVSADGMIKLCKETGPIATIPEVPGLVVWKTGHIGVYIGGGYTVEMRGFAYDCVKRKVTDGPWTRWGRLPATMLQYTDMPAPREYKLGERELRKGDTGPDVKGLQEALLLLGGKLPKYGADGDFGSETEAAVRAFQKQEGLAVDGVFDTAAFKALTAALNPEPTPPMEDTDTPDAGSAPAYVLIIEGEKQALKAIQAAYGGTLAAVDTVVMLK
ncbi:MAG: peptidoglycan-binding protein [Oscillospiraceae bacterium]|nr:peptidoglycan-binding protein [Oscillospiraceae bacterium]